MPNIAASSDEDMTDSDRPGDSGGFTPRRLRSSDEDDAPVPVGAMMDRLVRSFGAPSSSAIETVFSNWDELVGPQMAGHVRPLGVEDDCLVLGVSDPAWASQVTWLGPELVAKLAKLDGESRIARVEIRVVRPRR